MEAATSRSQNLLMHRRFLYRWEAMGRPACARAQQQCVPTRAVDSGRKRLVRADSAVHRQAKQHRLRQAAMQLNRRVLRVALIPPLDDAGWKPYSTDRARH